MNIITKNFRLILSLFAIMSTLIAYPYSTFHDTLAEQLLDEGNYRASSIWIKEQLKKEGASTSNDERLYYYNTLSIAYFRLNQFDSSMMCAKQAFDLSLRSKDSTLIVEAWKVMSYSYNRLGQLDSAIYFSEKLLNYAKKVGDSHQYSHALSSMATILMQNRQPLEALKNFREAKRLNRLLHDTAVFPIDYFNLGLTHLKLKNHDSSLYYLNKALECPEIQKKPDLQLVTYGTLSDCFLALGQKDERMKYLRLAMDIGQRLGSTQFMAMSYCNIMQGALEENDFNSVIRYGTTADSLLKKEPFPVQQMKVDSMMYVAFKNLSKFAEALARYERFVEIKSRVISENQTALLNRVMVEYEVKEKNLRIEKQATEILGKTRQIQLLLLLFVITTLLSGGLLYQNRKLQRSRESLYRKEKYLERQLASNKKLQTGLLSVRESPHVLKHELPPDAMPQKQTDVDPGLLDALYVKIISIMEDQQLYLDPELSVKALVSLMGTNKTYIYQTLARNSSENFRGFINRYRVNEAKRVIEGRLARSEALDVSSLYLSSGFNSSVSFFRAFKYYTGLTPREYASETAKRIKTSGLKEGETIES